MSLISSLGKVPPSKDLRYTVREKPVRTRHTVLAALALVFAVLPCAAQTQQPTSWNQFGILATSIQPPETPAPLSSGIRQTTPSGTESRDFRRFTADFGGGWTWVQGGGVAKGLTFRGGAGWRLSPQSALYSATGDRLRERHWSLYLVGEFTFIQSGLTNAGLQQAIKLNQAPSSATSGTARYYNATADPTFRYCVFRCRVTFYGLGGFGWMHRTVEFDGLPTATSPIGSNTTVASFGYDSAAYNVGWGLTLGPFKPTEGLTYYVEVRRLTGFGPNGNNTLWPLWLGIRW